MPTQQFFYYIMARTHLSH